MNIFTKKRMSGDYSAEGAAANHLAQMFSPRRKAAAGKKGEGGGGSGSDDDMAPMMVEIDMEYSMDNLRAPNKSEGESSESESKMLSSGEGEVGEGAEESGGVEVVVSGGEEESSSSSTTTPTTSTPPEEKKEVKEVKNEAKEVAKGVSSPRRHSAVPVISIEAAGKDGPNPPPAPMLEFPASVQSPKEDPLRLVTPRTAGLIQTLTTTSVNFSPHITLHLTTTPHHLTSPHHTTSHHLASPQLTSHHITLTHL